MIELRKTLEQPEAKAKTKAQQIREYVAAHPNATPTQIAEAMGVNRQYIYTVMYKVKAKAKVKKHRKVTKKLGRPRKVTEASANLNRLMEEYRTKKAQSQVDQYWKAVGEVQKAALSPERIAELSAQAAKAKHRLGDPTREPRPDPVNHPAHYKVGGIETIDFIEAKKLNYNIGNVVKYLTRADHKGNRKQDLEKALWYLNREIGSLK